MPVDCSLAPELEEIRQRTRDFVENAVQPIAGRISAADKDTGATRTATGDLPL